ncbi:hypothetical protein BC834DRAFT_898972 [Gloeopeniophorella convolvens]|nr:hypothetical protein BC834DRAFT_898972 [Gloeopeniophorella convolvens]
MTFATLRALQAIIAVAIDEIQAAYAAERPPSPSDSPPQSSFGTPSASASSFPPPNKQHRAPTPPLLSLSNHTLSSASHYSQSQASHLPTPPSDPGDDPFLDFPNLDSPGDPASPAEILTSRPDVTNAISRIIAAASQLSVVVRSPFLTLCDASMVYHLPSCLRFLEATHIPELLSAAGPAGLSVIEISASVGVDSVKISHILRLLATHHIIRERAPDIFTLNRVSALLDSGRSFTECRSAPDKKYDAECGGVPALVALNTDELFKASAYLTDSLASPMDLSPKRSAFSVPHSRSSSTEPPFSPVSSPATASAPALLPPISLTPGPASPSTPSAPRSPLARAQPVIRRLLSRPRLSGIGDERSPSLTISTSPRVPSNDIGPALAPTAFNLSQRTTIPYWTWLETPENATRLARFARAMAGTEGWMGASDAELCAFPFPDLEAGALVVDVGGGIGSTTLRLAERFPRLRFIIQDREPVCKLGEDAWRIHSPGLIKSGRVRFEAHDFFKPQPVHKEWHKPAVFLLRVICHDWPDALARRILLRLRRAAEEGAPNKRPTYLVIGDHLLPYACTGAAVSEIKVEGGTEALPGARWPLLANLGAASANAYWMDMTMQVTFGGQERTLPELRALAESAGWRLIRVARAEGSLFAHVVAEPGPLPSGPTGLESFPSIAALQADHAGKDDEEDVPPAAAERGAAPLMDMLGAARSLLRAGTGAKKGGSGETVWARWMQRRVHANENDARRGPTEKSLPMPIPVPSPGGQSRGLLRKVSQYFGEGS